MHFITLLTLPCVLALPAIQVRQACQGDTVPQCDDTAKTWSRCDNGNIVPMGTFGDGWSCDALRGAYPQKRDSISSFKVKRQACEGDGVPQCDETAKTWSRCDNGNVVSMGTFGDGWSCDALRGAYSHQKRSAIPSILSERQACEGDSVPQCDDTAKTWSRCDNGNVVSMGTFGDGWSCDALRGAYSHRKRSTIPAIFSKRQACEGDGVPECNDAAQTWSRCSNGLIVPMGTFGAGWSCQTLRDSFAGHPQ